MLRHASAEVGADVVAAVVAIAAVVVGADRAGGGSHAAVFVGVGPFCGAPPAGWKPSSNYRGQGIYDVKGSVCYFW